MKAIIFTFCFLLRNYCTYSEVTKNNGSSPIKYTGYKIPDIVRHRIHTRAPGVYDLPRGIGKYKPFPEAKTFQDALITCANDGAWLAILETYAEASILKYMYEEYVQATGQSAPGYWVGCDDRDVEGFFVTIKNEPMKASGYYLDWDKGEPNNAAGNEDCCAIRNNTGLLNAVICSVSLPFFCEAPLDNY